MHLCFQGASGSGWAVDFEAHLECKELIAAVRTVVVLGPCRHGMGHPAWCSLNRLTGSLVAATFVPDGTQVLLWRRLRSDARGLSEFPCVTLIESSPNS